MSGETVFSILFVVAILWSILFFSSSAVMILERGPYSKGENVEALTCGYFTGTGFFKREYAYSPNGFMGKEACPRLISFGEKEKE